MLRIHAYNIDNIMFPDIVCNTMVESLGLVMSENYLTKDGKKVGGFFQDGDTMLCFINTKEIPDEVMNQIVLTEFYDKFPLFKLL